uniref:STI1 domain-containing protein n=1 Tax=Glossina pallidipes TaxID=7398 RepID=A0A1B0A3C6_GLOPL
MAAPFASEDLEKLKKFIDFVSQNPLILNMPQLEFVKIFIEKFGGKVPEGTFEMPAGGKCPFGGNIKTEAKTSSVPHEEENNAEAEMDVESDESEIELDMEVASARRTENNTTTDTTETPNVVYLEEKPYKRCNRKRKSMKSEKSKRKSKTKIAKKKVRCFNNVNMDPLYTSEILIKTEQTDDEELIGQSSRYNNPTHIDDMFDDKDADFVLESDKDDEPLIMLRKKRGRPAKYPPRDDLFDDRRRKEPRPIICGSLCKQKCAEKFTEKQRILMCDHYWNLNREKRIDYIRSHTKAKRSIRLRRRGECKRNNVCVYYLEDVALQNAALIRVCRSYFEATLRLSHYDIKKALDGFELQPELEVKPVIIETKESRNYRNQYTKRKEVEQTLDPVTGNLVPLYACASENITNLSSTDGSKLKKKRIRRDPTQPVARSPRPINCAERCIYKCHTKFTEEQRQQICSNFWTMDYKRRKDFILSRVETREILYETTPEFRKSNRPPRTYHTRFYLRAGLHGENQRVCKSFMMATLRIGHHFISNALQFADQTTGYYTGGDRRGQHTPGNKISSERIEEIKQHIAAYPTWMPNKKTTGIMPSVEKIIKIESSIESHMDPLHTPELVPKSEEIDIFEDEDEDFGNDDDDDNEFEPDSEQDDNEPLIKLKKKPRRLIRRRTLKYGVIPPDRVPEQSTIDFSKNSTEEEIDKASELRSEAAAAYSEQRYGEAIDFYTQAIELNPGNALFHAKRGQAFLKLQKPNACIRDCNRALAINCDSAAAYKFRGRAHRLLGNWEEAAKDLRQACKLDFDEEADEWLREVTPNAKKIEQHRLKQQRKKDERDRKAREVRREKARTEASQQQQQQQQEKNDNTSMPGGFSAGANLIDLLSSINDPEVMAALQDILKNPANIEKYKSNPKLAKIIDVFKSSFPCGVGGFPGGFPGSFPSTAGANDTDDGNTATAPPNSEDNKPQSKKPDFVDDGLD